MKKLKFALAYFLTTSIAWAQGVNTVGGLTAEACSGIGASSALTVTASSAYAINSQVGALISLNPSFRGVGSNPPDSGGIVQSVRLNTKDVQTGGFKAYQLTASPIASTFTNGLIPAIGASDVFKARGPVTLSSNDSGLGTMTVYELDAIARAHVASGATDYWILVTTGTPTFATSGDIQFCVTYLVD